MTKEEIKEQINDSIGLMYDIGYANGYSNGLNDIDGMREEVEKARAEAYEKGLNKRKEDDQDYKDGLDDGKMLIWQFIRKLGELTVGEVENLFNNVYDNIYDIVDEYSPSEFIAKIKEYEESKKQVNQWDEIYYNSNPKHKAVIINIGKENEWNCLDKDNEMVSIDIDNQKYWNKTGKNYSKCTNILEQLRGENNDN